MKKGDARKYMHFVEVDAPFSLSPMGGGLGGVFMELEEIVCSIEVCFCPFASFFFSFRMEETREGGLVLTNFGLLFSRKLRGKFLFFCAFKHSMNIGFVYCCCHSLLPFRKFGLE
ncbi:hypothetical protein Ancab_007318 [Ancistrocladus abbreviatus]